MIEFKLVDHENSKEVSDLADEIWDKIYFGIFPPKQIKYMLKTFQSKNEIASQIREENVVYNIIMIDDDKAGYFAYKKFSNLVVISRLCISRKYVFELVAKKVLSSLFELNLPIRITVNKLNKEAIEFYKSQGFVIKENVVVPIGKNFEMDDYVMIKNC